MHRSTVRASVPSILGLVALCAGIASGQGEADIDELVRKTAAMVREQYIDEGIAEEVAGLLEARLGQAAYARIPPQQVALEITRDLQAASGDLHFGMAFDPEQFAYLSQEGAGSSPKSEEQRLREAAAINYGFKELRILPGNVGYLKFDEFSYGDGAMERAHASMVFLGDAEAVIIDLRDNGGGWSSMEQLMCSYFLPYDGELPLIEFFTRSTGESSELGMLEELPQERIVDEPLFVLTSRRTFSAAESLAYNLAVRGRARILGERSAGGAHGVEFVPVAHGFVLKIPIMSGIVPFTGTNWEGVGVEPDVACAAEDALARAHQLAIETLLEDCPDWRRPALSLIRDQLAGQAADIRMDEELLRSFAGTYGGQTVDHRDGGLWFLRPGSDDWCRMIAVGERSFMVEGIDDFRVTFEGEGAEVSVRVELADGRTLRFPAGS